MKPTERFSSRVADYVKYRPSYPAAIVDYLSQAKMLAPDSVVADIGSGTGLLTELFLRNGNAVFGVEPNADMRAAGERQLQAFSRFTSINATAESTSLGDGALDLIVAGQAFHWFDPPRTRAEFARILRPNGYVALIWNERITTTPFLEGYEELLRRFSTDYAAVDHRQITPEKLAAFFAPNPVAVAAFANRQSFDFEGLRGRVFSSSYSPPAGHAKHEPMLEALRHLFDEHQADNRVAFEYKTLVYTTRLHC